MVKDSNRDSTTARYTSPHEADVKTLCKQECVRIVHSKRCRYALIPLVLFLTILVIYAIFDYPPDPPPPYCSSAACIRTGWNLKHAMNTQVKPCDDFYTYVCGGNWTKLSDKRIIGDDGESRNWLAENVSQEDAKPVMKAKLMFKVCMDRDARNPEGFTNLGKFYGRFGLPSVPSVLKRTEGWDMGEDHQFDWVDSVARIKRSLGLNVLIGVDVSNSNQLVLGYPNLPKGWNDVTSRTKIEHVAQLLEPVQTVASDMLQVADAINPGWNVTNRNDKFEDLGYQVQDFFRLLPNRSTTTTGDDQVIFSDLEPVIQRYLNLLFDDLPNSKPTSNDLLIISTSDRQYLKDLVKTMSTQYPEQIELYIWGLMSTFLVRHRYSQTTRTEETCSEQVRTLMAPAISFKEFEVNNRDDVTLGPMLNSLRAELEQTILAIDWMDGLSRNGSLAAVKAKLEILERNIDVTKLEEYFKELQVGNSNLENWINGLGFDSTNRLNSWRTTFESHWDPDFLRKPFRDLGLDSLNYGTLGVTLISDFLSDLDVRLSISSRSWYQAQASKCFADYRSIRETAGLRLAQQAYQKRTEQEAPLPELGFPGEQALFISYGWQICNEERSERSKARINEAVRNVRNFGKVFECPAGSGMNPDVRCEVW